MKTKLCFIASALVTAYLAAGTSSVAATVIDEITATSEGVPPAPPPGFEYIGIWEDENGTLFWRYENDEGRVYLVPYDPL